MNEIKTETKNIFEKVKELNGHPEFSDLEIMAYLTVDLICFYYFDCGYNKNRFESEPELDFLDKTIKLIAEVSNRNPKFSYTAAMAKYMYKFGYLKNKSSIISDIMCPSVKKLECNNGN